MRQPGGWQSGKNRDGMNEAFVQDAEHDIDRGQRGKNQEALIGERALKGGRGALEATLNTGRHVQIFLRPDDSRDCASQCCIGSQVERNGHCRKLALVID